MTEAQFCEQYNRYKNSVFAVVYNYVQNTADAEDILQDVFLKFYSSEVEFADEEHVKAWLIRVGINASKNHLRKVENRSATVLDESLPYDEKSQDNELLFYVQRLPEKYRIPVHLYYYESYSVKEIAQILEMPQATVKIRLKRGREQLGKILVKEEWL